MSATRSEAPAELDPDAVVVPREMPAPTAPAAPRRQPKPDPMAAHQAELGMPVENPLGDLDRQPAVFASEPGRGLPGSPTPSLPVHDSTGPATGRADVEPPDPADRSVAAETRGDPESDDAAAGATGGAAAGALAGAMVGGPIGMIPGAVLGAAAGMAVEGGDVDDEPGHEVDDRREAPPTR